MPMLTARRPRTGILLIAIAAALTLLVTLVHVFPPHETYLTMILGLAGALSYTFGIGTMVGGIRGRSGVRRRTSWSRPARRGAA
jgi:hypothetical protein